MKWRLTRPERLSVPICFYAATFLFLLNRRNHEWTLADPERLWTVRNLWSFPPAAFSIHISRSCESRTISWIPNKSNMGGIYVMIMPQAGPKPFTKLHSHLEICVDSVSKFLNNQSGLESWMAWPCPNLSLTLCPDPVIYKLNKLWDPRQWGGEAIKSDVHLPSCTQEWVTRHPTLHPESSSTDTQGHFLLNPSLCICQHEWRQSEMTISITWYISKHKVQYCWTEHR